MSLPPGFSKHDKYFNECLIFFEKYQYLFNCSNTDVLINNNLELITVENLDIIKIFDEDYDVTRHDDEFLVEFFKRIAKFKVCYDDFVEDSHVDDIYDAPLSEKKRHEIKYLAKEIKTICEQKDCGTVVDFGAGLGYLDQLLYKTSNCKVLGIECNDGHYVGAKKRQRKYHLNSIDDVKYVKHTINEESHSKIHQYLDDKFKNCGRFCITGLHACADLTVTAINIFLNMPCAVSMVLVPCCYHLMLEEGGRFKNFPLSDSLKRIYEERVGFQFMGVPFLRLGAHPPKCNEDLEEMVFNLLARATLQLYAYRHGCRLRRNKRKAVKTLGISKNFEKYVQDALKGFTLSINVKLTETHQKDNSKENSKGDVSRDFDVTELMSIWRQISQDTTFKKAAIFILLQKYLQPVIENFVLYDRLVYLSERGIQNCRYKKIFNESISPRCLALLVCK